MAYRLCLLIDFEIRINLKFMSNFKYIIQMKKYLFFLIAMLMSVSTLALVGCSSDDDGDEQGGNGNYNGKVSVKYEGATTENYSVQQATFQLFSQSVEGTTHYDYDNGATFNVTFTDGDNYYTYWQFQSRENIKAGQKLAVSAIFFGDDSVRSTDECSGNATVKSINSDKITIEFKDFSFERYTSISSSNKQEITINGTITFTLDE